MPPKGKKNNNKNASSSANVTGDEPSSTASSSNTSPPNPSVAPPLASIFTIFAPDRGRSPSKRPRANTNTPPPAPAPTPTPTQILAEELTAQGRVLKETAHLLGNFRAWCEPRMALHLQEIEALEAEIKTLHFENKVLLENLLIIQEKQEEQEETPKPSYASVAATTSATIQTKTTTPTPPPSTAKTKKGPKTPTLLTEHGTFTTMQRELIVQLTATIPPSVTDDTILATANEAIAETTVQFCLARRTRRGNILLQTNHSTSASSAMPHKALLLTALHAIGCQTGTIRPNAICTSFLVHNIPTSLGPNSSAVVATAIAETYPTLLLCRRPRWLTTNEKRKEKTHSTMVITLPFNLTIETLGTKYLTLFNKDCRLGPYSPPPPPPPTPPTHTTTPP
ncbi:hypothetical protein Q9L58_010751 [Maublancomyces gigas]|uniref:Uncharacterized protein n=1 Tax=Discina gigas TaxID=1032678 RepID=A0ABR3G3V3_9PEZI